MFTTSRLIVLLIFFFFYIFNLFDLILLEAPRHELAPVDCRRRLLLNTVHFLFSHLRIVKISFLFLAT